MRLLAITSCKSKIARFLRPQIIYKIVFNFYKMLSSPISKVDLQRVPLTYYHIQRNSNECLQSFNVMVPFRFYIKYLCAIPTCREKENDVQKYLVKTNKVSLLVSYDCICFTQIGKWFMISQNDTHVYLLFNFLKMPTFQCSSAWTPPYD